MSDPSTRSVDPMDRAQISELETALRLLQYPVDPATVASTADPARRKAALWAHVAAWATRGADAAAERAQLRTDERIALRAAADTIPATTHRSASSTPEDDPATVQRWTVQLLDLQQRRLTAVNHATLAVRGGRPHPIADACLSTVDAAYELLDTWRMATPAQVDADGSVRTERVRLAPRRLAMRRLAVAHQMLATAIQPSPPPRPG